MRETGESTEFNVPHETQLPEQATEESRREKLFGRNRGEIPPEGERLERHPEVVDRLQAGIDSTREGIERWSTEDQARAEHWFGSSAPEVRQHLAGVFERIDSAKENVRLKPFPENWSKTKSERTFAAVWPDEHVPGTEYDVHVGRLYEAADGPPDSKTGILVHELSHFHEVAGTLDAEDDYGRDGARRVAERSTQEALRTGDNIEYFFEDYDREERRAR